MMKTYLAMLLCFSLLMHNPAETATVTNNPINVQCNPVKAITEFRHEDVKNNLDLKTKQTSPVNAEKNGLTKEGRQQEKETVPYTPEELDLLARLVHAEAKGEPFQGKVAVAATVLNRVKSPHYPDSIRAVIYQYNFGYQYCPVRNGQINRPADKTARRAVEEALKGNDPTGGALSFYNPAKSANRWIRNRIYLTSIGKHIFVK